MPLEDYRAIEEFEKTLRSKRYKERQAIRRANAEAAWSKKYGDEYSKRKNRRKMITKTITPAEAAKIRAEIPKPSIGNVKSNIQINTPKGAVGPNRKFVGNKAVGKVAGEISTVAKNIYSPVYTGTAGLSQTYTGVNVTNPSTGVTKFTPTKEIAKTIGKATGKKATGKAIVKLAAKGATRLIPGIGTALLIKDVYDVNKWAMSQPKKKKKDANIYGTVSKNNIYKGY
tara:strand:+ start:1293 stop:1976 length:684 start_codon:yes stop_codon:yes gene_type:complete